MTAHSLTIGGPAHNEEESLESVVEGWLAALPRLVEDFEILLVNDGSQDGTAAIMERLRARDPRIRVIHHPYNLGFRGFAQTIANNARKSLLSVISCDGEYDLMDLEPMLERVQQGADVVVGVRRSLDNYSPYRRVVSRSYNGLVELLFGESFHDIGSLKLYRTEVIQRMDLLSHSAFINAERLIRASRAGYRIEFTTISHRSRVGGRARGARFSWVRDSTIDMLRLWWRLRQDGERRQD